MRLGQYDVEDEIGRGGAGTVYRARGPQGSVVAVKVIRLDKRPDAAERFERERRLLAVLGEVEGFVPLLDAWTSGEHAFVVMPLLAGGTLRDRLGRGKLSLDVAVALATTLARAVGKAHARGIVHRDLKPENVLFAAAPPGADDAPRPLVADLGLAKHFLSDAPGASASVGLSNTREIRGTAGFMSPEQLLGSRGIGPPADVFALGAILFECLTGEPAIPGGTLIEVLARTEAGTFTPLDRARPDAPAWLTAVVARSLAREPGARFPDGEHLARALESRSAGPSPHAALARRTTGLFLLALAVLIAVAVAHSRRSGGPAPSLSTASPAPIASSVVAAFGFTPAEPLPEMTSGFRHSKRWRLTHVLGGYEWKTTAPVTAVAISPDGRFGLSTGDGDDFALWDLATGLDLRHFAGHAGAVEALAFSPDGKRALSASADRTARLWDLATGALLARLEGHTDVVRAVSFSPDGARALTGGRDTTIRLWDLEPANNATPVVLAPRRVLTGHTGPVRALAFSPDGLRALSGSGDRTLRLWDLTTVPHDGADSPETQRFLGPPGHVVAVALLPGGTRAVMACDDGSVSGFELAAGGRAFATFRAAEKGIAAAAVSSDGSRLVVGGFAAGGVAGMSGVASVWDLERALGGDLSHALEATLEGARGEVRAVAIAPDGRTALMGAGRGLERRELRRRAPPPANAGHGALVRALAITADGSRLVSASIDRTLGVWDTTTGQETSVLRGHTNSVTGVALTPDGRRAVSASFDHTLRVWDLATGALTRTLEGHTEPVNGVACLPDSLRAISASSDRTLRLWDLSSGATLRTYRGHSKSVLSVQATATSALSSGADHTLCFWDLARDEPRARRGPSPAAGSTSVTILAGGERALSIAEEELHVWDVASAELVRTIELGQKGNVWTVAASPDGREAAVQSSDGSIKTFDLASGDELDRIDLGSAHDWAACVAYTPDNRSLVAGTARGVILRFERDPRN